MSRHVDLYDQTIIGLRTCNHEDVAASVVLMVFVPSRLLYLMLMIGVFPYSLAKINVDGK